MLSEVADEIEMPLECVDLLVQTLQSFPAEREVQGPSEGKLAVCEVSVEMFSTFTCDPI